MLQGSMVALVTPMKSNGAVDFTALTKLIAWHIESGTKAIVLMGTTGESATINDEDQRKAFELGVKQAHGQITIIAGTAANGTEQAIMRTRVAKELGVDACLILTPAYIKPTQEGLFQHYHAIAEAVAIPQILYNVPSRTACDMQAETVARLAKHANIVGIKEATGDMSRAVDILRLCGESFAVYSGDDGSALALMLLGGHGVISVTANVAPKLMSAMWQHVFKQEIKSAIAINNRLALLHKLLFVEANPIPVKWCLQQLGLIEDGIRLPLTPLSSTQHAALHNAMHVAELL